MTEFFLVSRTGRIINVASGDNLTAATAAEALKQRPGERVTTHVTQQQLLEYERESLA